MNSQTYRAAVNARLDEVPFTEGGNTFHARTALCLNPLRVCASLHFGRWRSRASVDLVLLADTSDRLQNMSRSATGHSPLARALNTLVQSCRATMRSTVSHPRDASAGDMWSLRRRPVTSRAAKLTLRWTRLRRHLEAPPQTDKQYVMWGNM